VGVCAVSSHGFPCEPPPLPPRDDCGDCRPSREANPPPPPPPLKLTRAPLPGVGERRGSVHCAERWPGFPQLKQLPLAETLVSADQGGFTRGHGGFRFRPGVCTSRGWRTARAGPAGRLWVRVREGAAVAPGVSPGGGRCAPVEGASWCAPEDGAARCAPVKGASWCAPELGALCCAPVVGAPSPRGWGLQRFPSAADCECSARPVSGHALASLVGAPVSGRALTLPMSAGKWSPLSTPSLPSSSCERAPACRARGCAPAPSPPPPPPPPSLEKRSAVSPPCAAPGPRSGAPGAEREYSSVLAPPCVPTGRLKGGAAGCSPDAARKAPTAPLELPVRDSPVGSRGREKGGAPPLPRLLVHRGDLQVALRVPPRAGPPPPPPASPPRLHPGG